MTEFSISAFAEKAAHSIAPQLADKIRNGDYDFLNNVGEILMLVIGGSYAYGTNQEGSDIDVRGIFIPKEDIGQTHINEATDTTLTEVNLLIERAVNGNWQAMEILLAPEENILFLSNKIKPLLKQNKLFLSKQTIAGLRHYANKQIARAKSFERWLASTQREKAEECAAQINEIIGKHIENGELPLPAGDYMRAVITEDNQINISMSITSLKIQPLRYVLSQLRSIIANYEQTMLPMKCVNHDVDKASKAAMHALRAINTSEELCRTGHFQIRRNDPEEHEQLMRIRNGACMKPVSPDEPNKYNITEEFWKIYNEAQAKEQQAFQDTTLPEKPDEEAIAGLLNQIEQTK